MVWLPKRSIPGFFVYEVLICDIGITKHELPRFGHPFEKKHYLKNLMFESCCLIVHGSIILRRRDVPAGCGECSLPIFSSILKLLAHNFSPSNVYYHPLPAIVPAAGFNFAEPGRALLTPLCRHQGKRPFGKSGNSSTGLFDPRNPSAASACRKMSTRFGFRHASG